MVANCELLRGARSVFVAAMISELTD